MIGGESSSGFCAVAKGVRLATCNTSLKCAAVFGVRAKPPVKNAVKSSVGGVQIVVDSAGLQLLKSEGSLY